MKEFYLTLFEGHPIIKDGDNLILIDTGSPSTIHISNSLEFCSEIYPCSTNYMGLTTNKLSEMLGTEITTLLGADIISDYELMLDYKKKVCHFSKQNIMFEGQECEISSFMGIPVIELAIDNKILKLFLDTGAKLSYLPQNITKAFESVGIEEDFYPGVGKFKTDCYELPTRFEKNDFMVKYGNLPPMLESALKLSGVEGIIGYDFFNNFKVSLGKENKTMNYVRQTI